MREKIKYLNEKAKWLRSQVLNTIVFAQRGHIGGTFSCIDIFIALYYGGILRFNTKNPQWPQRDRLIVGKGHACLALYHIWVDLGMLSKSRLEEFGTNGSSLSGQLNLDTPGAEYNTGSLGHALGITAGMAMAAKMDKNNYRCFALVGDGECAEGSIWESVMFASKHRLNNLVCIVDRNRLGVTEFIEEDDGSGRLDDKFKACGFDCITLNGHSFESILNVFSDLDRFKKPLAVIADTVKGKGVSFMENGIKWHHSVPTEQEAIRAREELAIKG